MEAGDTGAGAFAGDFCGQAQADAAEAAVVVEEIDSLIIFYFSFMVVSSQLPFINASDVPRLAWKEKRDNFLISKVT